MNTGGSIKKRDIGAFLTLEIATNMHPFIPVPTRIEWTDFSQKLLQFISNKIYVQKLHGQTLQMPYTIPCALLHLTRKVLPCIDQSILLKNQDKTGDFALSEGCAAFSQNEKLCKSILKMPGSGHT
jgi:hypothetical protein